MHLPRYAYSSWAIDRLAGADMLTQPSREPSTPFSRMVADDGFKAPEHRPLLSGLRFATGRAFMRGILYLVLVSFRVGNRLRRPNAI